MPATLRSPEQGQPRPCCPHHLTKQNPSKNHHKDHDSGTASEREKRGCTGEGGCDDPLKAGDPQAGQGGLRILAGCSREDRQEGWSLSAAPGHHLPPQPFCHEGPQACGDPSTVSLTLSDPHTAPHAVRDSRTASPALRGSLSLERAWLPLCGVTSPQCLSRCEVRGLPLQPHQP